MIQSQTLLFSTFLQATQMHILSHIHLELVPFNTAWSFTSAAEGRVISVIAQGARVYIMRWRGLLSAYAANVEEDAYSLVGLRDKLLLLPLTVDQLFGVTGF